MHTGSASGLARVMEMRVTVLGGCGAWPEAGQACSGYLVEHDGFPLLVAAGFGTMPRLRERVTADQVDAVFISHGHPDHCADLNPLLRARALRDDPPPPLPVYALPGALDAVLALDRPRDAGGRLRAARAQRRHQPGHRPLPGRHPLTPALAAQPPPAAPGRGDGG